MPLLALALAVGTAGMAMGADLTGEWRPSFIVASELPDKTRMVVKFNPGGEITGNSFSPNERCFRRPSGSDFSQTIGNGSPQ